MQVSKEVDLCVSDGPEFLLTIQDLPLVLLKPLWLTLRCIVCFIIRSTASSIVVQNTKNKDTKRYVPRAFKFAPDGLSAYKMGKNDVSSNVHNIFIYNIQLLLIKVVITYNLAHKDVCQG